MPKFTGVEFAWTISLHGMIFTRKVQQQARVETQYQEQPTIKSQNINVLSSRHVQVYVQWVVVIMTVTLARINASLTNDSPVQQKRWWWQPRRSLFLKASSRIKYTCMWRTRYTGQALEQSLEHQNDELGLKCFTTVNCHSQTMLQILRFTKSTLLLYRDSWMKHLFMIVSFAHDLIGNLFLFSRTNTRYRHHWFTFNALHWKISVIQVSKCSDSPEHILSKSNSNNMRKVKITITLNR